MPPELRILIAALLATALVRLWIATLAWLRTRRIEHETRTAWRHHTASGLQARKRPLS